MSSSEPTDQQIRVAVAQALGWKREKRKMYAGSKNVEGWGLNQHLPEGSFGREFVVNASQLPDCFTDAACREMRQTLDDEDGHKFVMHIFEALGTSSTFKVLNASPREQALAFLKTKNLMV